MQQTFKISRVGNVAGCRVLGGVVERKAATPIATARLSATTRSNAPSRKDEAQKVRKGYSAASSWPDSTTSRKANCSEITRSRNCVGSSESTGVGSGVQHRMEGGTILYAFTN